MLFYCEIRTCTLHFLKKLAQLERSNKNQFEEEWFKNMVAKFHEYSFINKKDMAI